MNCNYIKHGEVNSNRGKLHDYLVIYFDFTEKEKVKIIVDDYVERMTNELPTKIGKIDTDFTPNGFF